MSKEFKAGVIAGFINNSIVAPVDFMKIKYQISKQNDIIDLIKKRKFKYFWTGNCYGSFYSALYCGIQFNVYNYSKKNISKNHFFNGALAGFTSVFITHPLSTIKTRLISQNKFYKSDLLYRNVFDIIKFQPKTLYNGIFFNLFSIIPYGAIKFNCYEKFKNYNFGNYHIPITATISAGLAQIVIMPIDNLEKNLQIYRFNKNLVNLSFYKYIQNKFKKEGFLLFYKGLSFALVKQGISASVIFSIYEYFLKLS